MDDLIAALQILRKYLPDTNKHCPTHCEHDILMVMDVDPTKVSTEDAEELDRLGFHVNRMLFLESHCGQHLTVALGPRVSGGFGEDAFASFRFGSA